MHPQLQTLFDEAETRYLQPDELGVISHYVSSLPERLETYRRVRDQEVEVMQKVADQLVAEMPKESVETLERSIKNALLVLRYCAMGVLLDDEAFVTKQLQSWLGQTLKVYNLKALDSALYRLLNHYLSEAISPEQMRLLRPMLKVAQPILLHEETPTVAAIGW